MEDLIVVIEESLPSIVISVVDADTNIKIPPNTNTNSLGSLSGSKIFTVPSSLVNW